MNDPGVWRNDAEVLKRLLSPSEERVPFLIPSELQRGVQVGGISLGVVIDLHGMIDDEFYRLQRIHLARVTAKAHDAVTHRREVDNRRHAGEILQQHSSGSE